MRAVERLPPPEDGHAPGTHENENVPFARATQQVSPGSVHAEGPHASVVMEGTAPSLVFTVAPSAAGDVPPSDKVVVPSAEASEANKSPGALPPQATKPTMATEESARKRLPMELGCLG